MCLLSKHPQHIVIRAFLRTFPDVNYIMTLFAKCDYRLPGDVFIDDDLHGRAPAVSIGDTSSSARVAA